MIASRYASESVRKGVAFLVDMQSPDGFWRDYDLPPGTSEDWTTAWIGWCLTHAARHRGVALSLGQAVRAIISAHRSGGWGYNRRQTPDADSTSWCLRFLAAAGAVRYARANGDLEAYLDTGGAAHTFLDAGAGSWGDAHPDVTPVVGLALLVTVASPAQVFRVRQAVLDARRSGGVWSSFWWNSDAYATAWSVEFLARSGTIPQGPALDVREWLPDVGSECSAMALAHRLLVALAIGMEPLGEHTMTAVDALLDLADGERGWPPSALLLVPPRSDGSTESIPHADVAGLMSTATAVAALSRWIAAANGSYLPTDRAAFPH
ncbi:MAG: hypothetical protein ABW277_08200 [Longimicrobiaceae bacterium]